ncbi:hypothetical protein Hanom_Chr12g01138511 [Helianthus anomalus]
MISIQFIELFTSAPKSEFQNLICISLTSLSKLILYFRIDHCNHLTSPYRHHHR